MKFIKKAPLLLVIAGTGVLLTICAAVGKDNLYKEQESNLWKTPLLAVIFSGFNDEIYPWQLFNAPMQDTLAEASTEDVDLPGEMAGEEEVAVVETDEGEDVPIPEAAQIPVLEGEAAESLSEVTTPIPVQTKESMPEAAIVPTAAPTAQPTPYSIKNMRLKPFRESTREEYLNHISADIYGDAGVLRAAAYPFVQVDETYFDDALFIGDSRTVGLHDYTDLREHATFLCETSLTIHKVMEKEFKGKGTVEEVLAAGDYGKIYLMVGINELGYGTTEAYMEKYTEVVDKIHELEPEALIFLQGTMRVSGEKSRNDDIFNNQNINARNHAIATLADNIQVFYIDINEVVCDAEGNLNEEYTFDQIHLLGMYNDMWKQFLLSRGVLE